MVDSISKDVRNRLKIFRAVSNKTRLAVLLALLRQNPSLSFTDLKHMFGLKAAALDYHLGVLLKAKLVRNVYKKDKSSKEYSYYELTDWGKKNLESVGITKAMVEGRMKRTSGK